MAKLVAKLAITCGIGSFIHVVNSNSKQKNHEGKFAILIPVYGIILSFLFTILFVQPTLEDRSSRYQERVAFHFLGSGER